MKNFVTALILLVSLTFTTQANSIDYEKTNITTVDCIDIGIVQIAEDYTYQVGNNQDNPGYHIYNLASGRYTTSITTSGYSENITINKGADRSTCKDKKQSSYSKSTQSWRSNRSDLRVRGTEASCTNLQGSDYHSIKDYRTATGNHNLNTTANPQIIKAISIYRNWSGSFDGWTSRDETGKTIVYTIAPNPIPLGWFKNITHA